MRSFGILRRNQRYIWAMVLVFMVGIGIGAAMHNSLGHLLNPQLQQLKDVAGDINKKNNSFYTSFRIFLNNVEVGVLYLPLLGILFGIYPIGMMLANGMIIGYILVQLAITKHLSIVMVLLVGILPHGIIEIPALVFSAAMAAKLGLKVIRPIKGYTWGQSLGIVVREYLSVLGLVVVMLAVAALIEGNITPLLLHHFLES